MTVGFWSPLGSSVMATPPFRPDFPAYSDYMMQVTADPGSFLNYGGFAGVYATGIRPDPDGWVRLSTRAFVDHTGDYGTDGSLFIGATGTDSLNISGVEFHWNDGWFVEINQQNPDGSTSFLANHNDTNYSAEPAANPPDQINKYGMEFNPVTGVVRGLIDDVVVVSATVVHPVDLTLKYGIASQVGFDSHPDGPTLFHFGDFHPMPPQQPSATATLSATHINVGDSVTLTTTVDMNGDNVVVANFFFGEHEPPNDHSADNQHTWSTVDSPTTALNWTYNTPGTYNVEIHLLTTDGYSGLDMWTDLASQIVVIPVGQVVVGATAGPSPGWRDPYTLQHTAGGRSLTYG